MFPGFGITIEKFQRLLKPPWTLSSHSSWLSPRELAALPEMDALNAGSWQPASHPASSWVFIQVLLSLYSIKALT